jgi:hypothetical protein
VTFEGVSEIPATKSASQTTSQGSMAGTAEGAFERRGLGVIRKGAVNAAGEAAGQRTHRTAESATADAAQGGHSPASFRALRSRGEAASRFLKTVLRQNALNRSRFGLTHFELLYNEGVV